MYKFLLCLRYLRTRYLAFVCIISIMLGVATLIVVNSVMSGFSNKLKDRLLGTSADITVGTQYFGGFEEQPEVIEQRILNSTPGRHIAAVAPSIEVVGTMQFYFNGRSIVKPVKVMGVNPAKQAKVGKFKEYLTGQKDRAGDPTFDLSEEALARFEQSRKLAHTPPLARAEAPGVGGDFLGPGPRPGGLVQLPPAIPMPELPPVETPKPIGIIVGHAIAHWSYKNPNAGQTTKNGVEPATIEVEALKIGDSVMVATLSGSDEMRPVYSNYVVTDFFKSEMSEYDAQFVYLPLEELQRLRQMDHRVTNFQLKLTDDTPKDYQYVKPQVAMKLHEALGGPKSDVYVNTWQDTQGPLLAAIDIERGILNLLLFMIVGVAGFSILSIFTMIVSEKYRDIGILKSLGASHYGVMGIFVWYSIFLGVVGCTLGTIAGLSITNSINEIEAWITSLSGQQLFDRSVYYFDKIPTNIESATVIIVNMGAMFVAVVSSLIPAVRAARLRPIQALRFE